MKDRIRKILKESDFDWTKENTTEVPIKEIEGWVDKTRYEVAGWIQKIEEFHKNSPRVDWSGKESVTSKDSMITLTVKGIGDELRNIYGSLDTIDGDIEYIRNPKMFDDE